MSVLLFAGLPEEYEGVPLSTDFRNMINVDIILQEEEQGSKAERVYVALCQLYEEIPADLQQAIDGLMWFYSCGKSVTGDEVKKSAKHKKGFSFSQDANMIYAAFLSSYGLSLSTLDYLHWWEFMALFEGLPDDTLIKRVMYWRTVDIASLPKHEKKHVEEMRKKFALKVQSHDLQPLTAEEVNRRTMDKVDRRYTEAQAALEKSRR